MTMIIVTFVHCLGEKQHGILSPPVATAELNASYFSFCDLLHTLANTAPANAQGEFNYMKPIKVVNQSDSGSQSLSIYVIDTMAVDVLCMTILCCLGTCSYLLGNKGAHQYHGNPGETPGERVLSRTQKIKIVEPEMDLFVQDILGMRVTLVMGDIQLEQVDVIACAVDNSLNLATSGAAARALLATGGKTLQKECWERFPSGIKFGNVIAINGGELKCRKVYLCSLPDYKIKKERKNKTKHPDFSNENAVKEGNYEDTNKHPDFINAEITKRDDDNVIALRNIICEVLNKATKEHVKSIALPAIGTSKMKLSPDKVANIMYDCVKSLPRESLSEVRFVMQHKATFQAFEKEHFMIRDENGSTILHNMTWEEKTDVVKCIADLYPHLINIRKNNGWHILHEVTFSGSIECLKLITDIVIENKDQKYREQFMLKCLSNSGSTILHKSCEQGHMQLSKYIADMYPSLINIRRNDGWHILHEVACSGSIECLKLITDIVIQNKNQKYREQYMLKCLSNSGSTILHKSCQQGHMQLSKYIADIYPNLINIRRNDGWHILHVVACSGSIECLKLITDIVIENKNQKYREQYMLKCLDNLGATILHKSCWRGHMQLSKYIADMYPSLINIRRNDGWHILHEVACSGSIECLKLITDIVIRNKDQKYREQYILKCLNNFGSTILHKSCEQGHMQLSKYIADMYPSLINIRRNDGWHILHEVACSGSIECLKLITDIVIKNKDQKYREQYMLKCLDNLGATILHISCLQGHMKLSKYIADMYPSLINIRRNDGWHILHEVACSGRTECLKLITDIVIENKDQKYREQYMLKCLSDSGSTILHKSCRQGHTQLSKYIADMYPSLINIRRNDGWHVLHEVACSGSIECLKLITVIVIENKDQKYREQYMLKCLDNLGSTILHISCSQRHLQLSKYIADMYPSLINIRRNDGWHILHAVACSGSVKCFEMITDIMMEDKRQKYIEKYLQKCLTFKNETVLDVSLAAKNEMMYQYIRRKYPKLTNH